MATALPTGRVTTPASFTGWVAKTAGTVRQLQVTEGADPSKIRQTLLDAGQELAAIRQATRDAGFRLLGLEPRAQLESLADTQVEKIPLADLSATLQNLTTGGFSRAVAEVPSDLVPGRKPPPGRVMPGKRVSPTLRKGGTVAGQAVELAMEAARKGTGIQPPEDPYENEPGCFRNVQTVHAEVRRPDSPEAGKKLKEKASWDDDKLEEWYDGQLKRMTDGTRDDYLKTAEEIAKLHDEYEKSNEEVLKAIKKADGRPSPKAWNEAKDNLERVIYESKYLSSRGIDPSRFSILETRHDEEVYRADPAHDPEVARSLKRRALAMESNYVVDTLAGMATMARDVEKNGKEFHRLDLLASHAKRLSLRLIANTQVLTTDADDLSFFRKHLFPFDRPERAIDWHSPAMGPVLEAVRQYRAAEEDYGKKVQHFWKTIAPATWKHTKNRTELTLTREELDYRFQVKRFHAEFERIRKFVEKKKGTIADDHCTYFEDCLKLLDKKHKENVEYWKGLASGEDVTARPATRNSKNKAEMALMAYVINLFLEDLYKIHKHPARPSWISFADNNVFTALDEAMERGVDPNDARAWLADFVDKFGILKDELGITFFGKKWFGREPDRHYVNAIASTAGSGFRKGHDGRTIVTGLQEQAAISLRETPHPDLELSDPDRKVYPEGFFERFQHYLLPILVGANHTGIEEFRIFVSLAALGLATPQLMQGGAADMPLAGDYGAAMSGILDRSKGADAVVELLFETLRSAKEIMFYFTGTRDSSGTGFHHYRKPRKVGTDGNVRYSNLHARRILTDDYATGRLETMIAILWNRRFQGKGRPVVLQPVIHNGNEKIPEKNWNLDPATSLEARITQILDNASPAGGLNAARDVPRRIGFMLPIPSTSFLTEWQEVEAVLAAAGEPLRHEDGSGLSPGEKEYLIQRVNVETTLWLQEEEASLMDLVKVPEQNDRQKKREAELRALTREQQMRESWYPIYRHMLDRLSDISPLPDYDTRTRPETLPSPPDEKRRLDRVMPRGEARAWLKGFPPQKGSEILKEIVQCGASYGLYDRKNGAITAIDGDGFCWDHNYEVGGDLLEILYREVVDGLSGPATSDPEARLLSNATILAGQINLRPEAVAWVIGYRARTGRAPVLYSSTQETRIYEMAYKATENRMAREFFKGLLGIDFYGWRKGDIKKAIDQAMQKGQIITRTQIAAYVEKLLNRYQETHFNPLAEDADGKPLFSDEERHDLLLMLRNGGDVHCKYRGLLPYRVLFDDRTANAWHAVSANRRGNDSVEAVSLDLHPFGKPSARVRVYQNESWSANPLEYFLTVRSTGPKPQSHLEERWNRGRDGSVAAVLRAAERDNLRPAGEIPEWTLVSRSRRPTKVDGLRDHSFGIPIRREDSRRFYLEPAQRAEELAVTTRAALEKLATEEETGMAEAARELAGLLDQRLKTADPSVSKPRLRNAVNRLKPRKGQFRPLAKQSEQTLLERAISCLEAENKSRAGALLDTLLNKRLYGDQVRAIRQRPDYPRMERSGVIDQITKTVQWIGNVARHQAIGAIGKELPQTKIGQKALYALNYPPSLIGLRGAKEMKLLLDLGDSLVKKEKDEKKEKDKEAKMKPERVVEAYGVVAKILGPDLLRWVLSKLATDERVPAATRLELMRHRGILEKRIEEVGKILQKRVNGARAIVNEDWKASAAVLGVGHAMGGIKELYDPLQAIWEQGAGTATRSLVVGVLNSILDEVKEGRKVRGEKGLPAIPEGDVEVGQQLVDTLLKELIILSEIFSEGGRNSVGLFLHKTRIQLDETGFEPFMQRLARFVDDFDWPNPQSFDSSIGSFKSFVVKLIYLLFPSERRADEILAFLRKRDAHKAQDLLVAQARLMLAGSDDREEALDRFSRLAEALWRHADPGDRETVREMIRKVHEMVAFDSRAA